MALPEYFEVRYMWDCHSNTAIFGTTWSRATSSLRNIMKGLPMRRDLLAGFEGLEAYSALPVHRGHVLCDAIRTTEFLCTVILEAPRSLLVVFIATVTVMLLVAIFVSLVGEGTTAFQALEQ